MRTPLILTWLTLAACQPVLEDVPRPDGGPRPVVFKHAHNDYEHTRPLLDALDQGFESFEVDVWLNGNDIGVSHLGTSFKGTLKSLYLDPMAEQVRRRGFVGRSPEPRFLWIDLKQGDARLLDLLATQLGEYPFLTRFADEGASTSRQVTVILTGDDAGKKALVARASPRPYARDSNSYRPDDPPADAKWGAYALNYGHFLSWNGEGTMPDAQRRQLENLVNGVHRTGRQLRLYACPETSAWWREAKQAGVDFIGGDDLIGIAAAVSQ
jgi:hypothetical protein